LGRGGMGSVWLAEHVSLETLCAVKLIDREAKNTPEARQRFHREAKAAAQLRSSHVVHIIDHGLWENIPYIVMEYLEGEDLAHRLDRVGRLSWGETFRIVAQAARALTKAHAAGIVHRDMKPANIFLARQDDDELAKVLDFGIAKHENLNSPDIGRTIPGILGTPYYMSPEQADGRSKVDYRSDLFSLAVITYQCLTGKLPFFHERLGDTLAQIMYGSLPVPSEQARDLPASFDAWWARAANRDVKQRFQSASEFAQALGVALQISETVDIPGLGTRERLHSSELFRPSSGSLKAVSRAAAPASPLTETIDEPFARTFEPEPTARKRRHLTLATAAIGVVALSGALLLMRNLMPGPGPTGAKAVTAAAVARPPEIAPVEASFATPEAPRPSAEASQAAPPMGTGSSSASAVAPQKAKLSKPAKSRTGRGDGI
ncbi:MAG TPA: protein kinase, partial [Polyangiaceae bacterium]